MASFQVVYDTCVLVPAPLRDLLLRVAEAGLVRAGMSDDGQIDSTATPYARQAEVTQLGGTRG